MELTEQQRERIAACLGAIELHALQTNAAMELIKAGKVRNIWNATSHIQNSCGETCKATVELRQLLDMPL